MRTPIILAVTFAAVLASPLPAQDLKEFLGLKKTAPGSTAPALGALSQEQVTSVDDYVTRKALDGLFLKIAEQEKLIRENPVARTTDLLQKVFGAVGK